MDIVIVISLLILFFIIILNIISILLNFPLLNEIAQTRVTIDGYRIVGDDGYVDCITSCGNKVTLIDKKCKFRSKCALYGGKEVRIRFHVVIKYSILFSLNFIIIGIE